MNYNEFQEKLKEELENRLPSEIHLYPVTSTKNNNTKRNGLQFQRNTSEVDFNLYLDLWYPVFLSGIPLSEIADTILTVYQKTTDITLPDTKMLSKYEALKGNIFCKLVNFQKNQSELQHIPYVPFLDLAIVFYVLLDFQGNTMKSMQIRNEHLHIWGINLQTLVSDAKENTERNMPAKLISLPYPADEPVQHKMYVLTNLIKQYGAVCFLQDGILQQIGEKLQDDFFLLPSSVHEVMIVKSFGQRIETLNEMIQSVNEAMVAPEDVLADHAYFYSRSRKELSCV